MGDHPLLEKLYWISQIVVVFAVIWAGFVARKQVETFKLFELLKFLQDENFRKSRRTVMQNIAARKAEAWWMNAELEACASTCCGSYDILGRMIKHGVSGATQRFFVKFWAESIVHTYSVLEAFIKMRADAGGARYEAYTWLYIRARKHCTEVPKEWPPRSSNEG